VPVDQPSGAAGQQPLLRGAVIHLNNEQPVVVDLYDQPTARDVAVICTNMRTQDGKRPIFIDHTESVFVIPLAFVRFIEIPPGADRLSEGAAAGQTRHRPTAPVVPVEPDIEIDEEFLKRIRDA